MPTILQWWNDPDNYGATGLEQRMSLGDALLKFQARPSAEPYEEWFAVCIADIPTPIGLIIVAPGYPRADLVSIGSIIIDKNYRRQGLGHQAIAEVEKWVKAHYPGLTLSLGVFEAFLGVKAFWEACGYTLAETVDTNYVYQGRPQRAFKFRKRLDGNNIKTEAVSSSE